MHFLITGSAGFIGHHLAKNYLQQGHRVTGIDNMNDYYSVDLKHLRNTELDNFKQYIFIKQDISDRKFIYDLFKSNKFDAVIHLAAQAGVRLPKYEFHKYTMSNLVGFENLATAAVLNNTKNFIYASSSSIYGNLARVPLSESELNLKPNSYYGATKLSNEIAAATIFHDSSTKARGLRLFSVYGPLGRPDMAYFRLIASSILNTDFKLNGDGSIERDFTYIDDVIDSITTLTENLDSHPTFTNDIVNIGGSNPTSMSNLIAMISKISGKNLRIYHAPNDLNDSIITKADVRKQKELIGKIPQTSLLIGLEKTYNWMRNFVDLDRLASWL